MIAPASQKAYSLLHEGSIALAEVEENGVCIDTDYLDSAINDTESEIQKLEDKLKTSKFWKRWRKKFGSKAKLSSRQQLAHMLYEEYEYEPVAYTATGRGSTSEAHLEAIDHPFVRAYFGITKRRKLLSTYLSGMRKHVCPTTGRVHCSYNLNVVWTYRSSCSDPNLQNIPIRNPEIATIIRRAFIPQKPGYRLVEIDYSGIEVRVAACYNKDPQLIKYIEDKSTDMHRDMAAQCFKVGTDQVSKAMRYCGKNMYVFPQFYGDFFAQCADQLWTAIGRMGLEVDGVNLYDHLADLGITELGDTTDLDNENPAWFMNHIRDVERDFWGRRFKRYAEWKRKYWQRYLDRQCLKTKTGFVLQGDLDRKQVTNGAIQGSAFHCLLQSLIWLIKTLRQTKLRAKIIHQIHDSILAEVHEDDVETYCILAKSIMVDRLREEWRWITVPLEVEAEVTPDGGSWHDKQEIAIAA